MFLGYSSTNQPQFVVSGTASGTKNSRSHGDSLYYDFLIGTREPTDRLSSAWDLALDIVALAIIQGSMGPDLQRIFNEPKFGQNLIEAASDGCHLFTCLPAFADNPVLLTTVLSTNQENKGFKHPLDHSRYSPIFRPMTTGSISYMLRKLGHAISLQQRLSYLVFRRTMAMNAVLEGSQPAHLIARSMGHFSGNKKLQRHTYRSSNRPMDALDKWLGLDTSTNELKSAVGQVGKMTYRPNPNLYKAAEVGEVRALLDLFFQKLIDEDDITAKFAHINSGQPGSLDESLKGLIKFVDGDDWAKCNNIPHMYISKGQNTATEIIQYLINAHENEQRGFSKVDAANEDEADWEDDEDEDDWEDDEDGADEADWDWRLCQT